MGGLKPLCKTLQPNKSMYINILYRLPWKVKWFKKKDQDQIIDFNWSCIPVKKKYYQQLGTSFIKNRNVSSTEWNVIKHLFGSWSNLYNQNFTTFNRKKTQFLQQYLRKEQYSLHMGKGRCRILILFKKILKSNDEVRQSWPCFWTNSPCW